VSLEKYIISVIIPDGHVFSLLSTSLYAINIIFFLTFKFAALLSLLRSIFDIWIGHGVSGEYK
jgi:hypothetical protein